MVNLSDEANGITEHTDYEVARGKKKSYRKKAATFRAIKKDFELVRVKLMARLEVMRVDAILYSSEEFNSAFNEIDRSFKRFQLQIDMEVIGYDKKASYYNDVINAEVSKPYNNVERMVKEHTL
jgi:hypothetical protein